MIRGYDDNGNVVDLVEWGKQIRAGAIEKFLMWLYHRYNVTMISGVSLDDLLKEYEEQTNDM